MRIRRGKTRNCGVEFGGKVGKDDNVGNNGPYINFQNIPGAEKARAAIQTYHWLRKIRDEFRGCKIKTFDG